MSQDELAVMDGGKGILQLRGVVGVDGFLAQHGSQLFEGSRLFTAQEDGSIHVSDNGICVILIDRLELTLRLQHRREPWPGNFPLSQLSKIGERADEPG